MDSFHKLCKNINYKSLARTQGICPIFMEHNNIIQIIIGYYKKLILEETTYDAWNWEVLLNLRPFAGRCITCRVGNGSDANFWFDS